MDINQFKNENTKPLVPVDNNNATEASVNQNKDDRADGLSDVEYNDPNQITVSVLDKNSPIVVLFGPPSCGKTMTLVRLARYLKEQKYIVNPDRTFRPAADSNYKNMCENFNTIINSSYAQLSTAYMSFMLLKVIDSRGNTVCQILEAPGEYYFNPKEPHAKFPLYVNNIANSDNRKIYCMIVEPDWMDQTDRMNYVDKIRSLKVKMRPRDKVIILHNKIDQTNYVISPGVINIKGACSEIEYQYPGLFSTFTRKTILGSSAQYKYVPFQTGEYYKIPGVETPKYDPSHSSYPRQLWDTILKIIRG